MATTRKSAVKKTTTAKTTGGKTKIKIHRPGVPSTEEFVKKGTTFGNLKEELNLSGYIASLNGDSEAPNNTVLKSGDTVRIGVKGKNA